MPELPEGGADWEEEVGEGDQGPWSTPSSPLEEASTGFAQPLAKAERLKRASLEYRAQFVQLEYPGGVERLPVELRLLDGEGYRTPGDSGAPQDTRPPWYDADLFLAGQRVARDNLAGLAEADMLSLFLLFAFPAGLDPLVATGRSDTPETAGKRYLSTNMRLMSWYSSDPFDPKSEAHRNLVAVRRMHTNVRKACNEASPEQLAVKFTIGKDQPRELTCPQAALFGQTFAALPDGAYTGPCPALRASTGADGDGDGAHTAALGAVKVKVDRYRRPFLSQGEMAITQWGFFGLFICKPQVFAAPRIQTKDLEALLHMWAVLGYCLGIEDRFNWGLGGLDAVLRRSEVYLRAVAVPNLRTMGAEGAARWEHMCRAMVDGMTHYVPLASFDVHLTYLAEDVLGLRTVLAKALSWRETLQLWRLRVLLQYLPRWLPAWGRWMSRGLRKTLHSKSCSLEKSAAL